MNELIIPIDWSIIFPLVASIFIRFMCFIIGFGAFMHFSMMSGGMPQETPWIPTVLMGTISFASWGLMLGGIMGCSQLIFLSFVIFSGSILLWALWIWFHGFHMNRFTEKLIEAKSVK